MPTKIIAGENCLAGEGKALAGLGHKALLVTGKASAKKCGAFDDAIAALKANGQSYSLFDRVTPNPSVALAYEAGEAAKLEKCDFVLAIGGGSPLDLGKAAAAIAVNSLPEDALFTTPFDKALPVAAVPTTAGTGSEVTQYAILTNPGVESKTSLANPALFPKLAFLDHRYLRGVSPGTTVNTALDALCHSIEGLLAKRVSPLILPYALFGIQTFGIFLEALKSGKLDDSAREHLLLASTEGGMVIANTGTVAVHAGGYALTYHKNIDHGRANGLLLGSYLDFVSKREKAVGKEYTLPLILGALGIDSLPAFEKELDALLGERENVSEAEAADFASRTLRVKNWVNGAVTPEEGDILTMFRRAFGFEKH